MTFSTEKVIERSVDSLQKIYAVIIALAIGQAIQALLKDQRGVAALSSPDVLKALPLFGAFLVTLVPFYHGMNRHLDHCYLEKTEVVQGALLFDFGVFFVEATMLFGVAWSVGADLRGFALLGGLLTVDMGWGFVSHFIHYKGQKPSIVRWSTINLIAIVAALFLGLTTAYSADLKPWLLMLVAILRTIADYYFCWPFYFPSTQMKEATKIA